MKTKNIDTLPRFVVVTSEPNIEDRIIESSNYELHFYGWKPNHYNVLLPDHTIRSNSQRRQVDALLITIRKIEISDDGTSFNVLEKPNDYLSTKKAVNKSIKYALASGIKIYVFTDLPKNSLVFKKIGTDKIIKKPEDEPVFYRFISKEISNLTKKTMSVI